MVREDVALGVVAGVTCQDAVIWRIASATILSVIGVCGCQWVLRGMIVPIPDSLTCLSGGEVSHCAAVVYVGPSVVDRPGWEAWGQMHPVTPSPATSR